MSARRPAVTVAAVDLGAGRGRVGLVALGEPAGIADIRTVVARTADLRTWSPRPDPRREQAAALLRERTQDDDGERGLIPT
ncbi:hypothetical protein ACI79C_22680 [Geodermatophilus sp. SYSU D00697]